MYGYLVLRSGERWQSVFVSVDDRERRLWYADTPLSKRRGDHRISEVAVLPLEHPCEFRIKVQGTDAELCFRASSPEVAGMWLAHVRMLQCGVDPSQVLTASRRVQFAEPPPGARRPAPIEQREPLVAAEARRSNASGRRRQLNRRGAAPPLLALCAELLGAEAARGGPAAELPGRHLCSVAASMVLRELRQQQQPPGSKEPAAGSPPSPERCIFGDGDTVPPLPPLPASALLAHSPRAQEAALGGAADRVELLRKERDERRRVGAVELKLRRLLGIAHHETTDDHGSLSPLSSTPSPTPRASLLARRAP